MTIVSPGRVDNASTIRVFCHGNSDRATNADSMPASIIVAKSYATGQLRASAPDSGRIRHTLLSTVACSHYLRGALELGGCCHLINIAELQKLARICHL